MKCRGNFKLKGISRVDAGEFVNDRGQKINYDASYRLKVDEITSDGIFERIFKMPIDSPLFNQLKDLKPYDDICIEFDVSVYGNGAKIIPVALVK